MSYCSKFPSSHSQAIDYAVEQHFDIISISIGFPQKVPGYKDLELAIERAVSARVLIFAAASNGGGNNDRAYPARESHVFCIHSTDAKGTRSKFSPTAENFVYNFATIGEAVESFWPTNMCADGEQAVRVKSGTSFATPIAAAIAAFLLLYARVHLEPEQATRLKRYAAMESLLHEVSKGARAKKDRDDYQYLFLSRHPDTFFGREEEEINNSFRKFT
jgi:subtilisin family serine protease